MGANEPDRPRGRILLIDDDPALGGYLSRVLRTRGGFEVVHEPDAAAGLRRIEEQSWDLLLTDIELLAVVRYLDERFIDPAAVSGLRLAAS